MFEVDLNCPYICNDCFELGCEFCNINEQIEQMCGDVGDIEED